ncbi:MAG: AraC family transcriptional regulator [Oscillospiraceae bacterium]|jgi:hypothetical protein|nr:AraC family transcriptional regulator [Oscillospiraceae bacterium]
MITTNELTSKLGLKALTKEAAGRELTSGYNCDLLSWVLAHGQAGMVWVTVQTHMNVVAVASLLDFACIILPDNLSLEPDALAKADEEGVAVFTSERTSYEICGTMWDMGIGR